MTRAKAAEIGLAPVRPQHPRDPFGTTVLRIITATGHKVIGILYLVTAFGFFLFAGLLAPTT